MYEEEKYNNDCYYDGRKERKNRCCVDVIVFILSVLFALTIGLIIASIPAIGAVLFTAIAALIILAIILAILIITRVIQLICNRHKCC